MPYGCTVLPVGSTDGKRKEYKLSEVKATKTAEPAPANEKVTVLKPAAPTVSPARFRRRHKGLIFSFFLLVALPTITAIYYLYDVAADQYSSRVSFSIRSEEITNPLDALGSLSQLSTGTSSDASILNEYLRSQNLVEDISKNIDLAAIYSKPENDPFFAYDTGQPIEDLVKYFKRMNYVSFDSNNGLLDIESFAFTAEDAQVVATEIMQASSALVERLSRIAQEDTTRLAKFELERAQERLTQTRIALGELRGREQTVDPRTDLESQMGVLTALQNKLAEALIEYDLLIATTQTSDTRVEAVQRTISAIEKRIVEERNKVGRTTLDGERSLAGVVGEFETLMSERQFAEQAYLSASVSYEVALAEARGKSKYLAAHIPPTKAQSSQYPDRILWSVSIFGICFIFWSVAVFATYAMFDRR